jgi:hypothetical protein
MLPLLLATLLAFGSCVTLGSLALYGLVSPYVACAFVILLGYLFKLSAMSLVVLVFCTYMCCLILQTLGSKEELSNSQLAAVCPQQDFSSKIQKKALILKILGILAIWILPIPKPVIFTGPIIFVLAAGLAALSVSFMPERGSAKAAIIVTIIQSVCLLAVMAILPQDLPNQSLGLISCLAIPALLMEDRVVYPKMSRYCPPRILSLLLAIAICLCTPGYSVGAICSAFFPNNQGRSLYHSLIEGCTEGWVLHQLSRNTIAAKTPLGDLLAAKPILAGTSEFPVALSLYLLLLFGLVLLLCFKLFAFWRGRVIVSTKVYRNLLLFSLITQAVVCLKLYCIPLLIVGVITYSLNRATLPAGNSINSLSILVPVSF